MKSIGKPDARNGHVRFDERGRETGRGFAVSTRARPRLYRRVQIPGYELVRSLSRTRKRSKLPASVLGHRCYLQSEIQEVLARATGRQIHSRRKVEREPFGSAGCRLACLPSAPNWTLDSASDSCR